MQTISQLADAYLTDTLTDAERAELNQRLSGNATGDTAELDEFVFECYLHSQLYEELGASQICQDLLSTAEPAEDTELSLPQIQVTPDPAKPVTSLADSRTRPRRLRSKAATS